MIDLTKEEAKAINGLKRLAKKWPESLWLYSASGTLHVMKKGEDGHAAILPTGGVDPDYAVTSVRIENDGGDW